MNAEYHIQVTTDSVGAHFASAALEDVIRANLATDEGLNQLRFARHFDNDMFTRGWAFVRSEQKRLLMLAHVGGEALEMRLAFGQLCHTVQDFYSHSNYVELWLDKNGGRARNSTEDIVSNESDIMEHPRLRSGHFKLWRDLLFHFKSTRRLMRRLWIPNGSHEAMHLDHPGRGPLFPYSLVAARQHTTHEFERARVAIQAAAGPDKVEQWLGYEEG